MQRFLDLFISINCSTCFRRFLHPLSGAQNCTYSVRYCQTNTAACRYRGWDLIHDSSRQQYWFDNTLYVQFCAPDDGRRNCLKHVEQFIKINRSRKRCILLVVLQRYTCDARTYERQNKKEVVCLVAYLFANSPPSVQKKSAFWGIFHGGCLIYEVGNTMLIFATFARATKTEARVA